MNHFYKFSALCLLLMLFCLPYTAKAQMSISEMRSDNSFTVNLSVPHFNSNPINYKGEEMSSISIPGSFLPNDKGMPDLPRISRFIAIPNGAQVEIELSSSTSKVISNIIVAPALEITPITEEPSNDYVKDMDTYSRNEFYPQKIAEVSPVTTVRGVNAVILGITPFQYNPVTKELIAYDNIEVTVTCIGGDGNYGIEKYRSRWFDPILSNVFLNYDALPTVDYSLRSRNTKDLEGCEYLIVIPNREDFRPYANIIKDLRLKQGIITKVMTLQEMGCTNVTNMTNFFHDAYNNWDIPLVAVLMMGDHSQNMSSGVPAATVNHSYSGQCISDNPYADVNGDALPEMAFARMAAETPAQLAILVSKVIELETTPCMDEGYYQHPITALGWQSSRWFQICNETIGGYWRNGGKEPARVNAIYDGNPGSVWSTATNTEMVVNYFGPSGLDYIPASPSTLGGWTGGTAAGVNNAINDGGFMLFHSDHGYEQGWGTPDYSNSNVAQLTNVGKLTYVIDNDCSTGKFDYSQPCFGEAFHRHTFNGQNAGAVGVLCPTEVSYSFVNDVYFWGIFDYFDPNFLPGYGSHPLPQYSSQWLPAFGNVAGKYYLAQSSWPYNDTDKEITYHIYEHHSDAFLRLATQVPQQLAIDHTPEIMVEVPFIITCTEGALISITKGDQILALVDATGEEQEIEVGSFEVDDTLTIVCTKQDYLRYETQLIAIPASGSYLVGRGWQVNDDNNDGILNYDETATIDCSIKNVGIETCNNTIVTISTDDPFISFINSQAEVGSIASGETVTVSDAFTVKVSPIVPDNYTATCSLVFSNGEQEWYGNITLNSCAPSLELVSFGVEGQLIPGQTVNIIPTFTNNGHASVINAFATFTTDNPYVTVNTTEPVEIGIIDYIGDNVSASFSITLSEDIPFGTDILSTVSISADHDFTHDFNLAPYVDICNVAISQFPYSESFEGGEITQCWNQENVNGENSWIVQEGGYLSHPQHAHTGEFNALIHGENTTTKLVTPTIDLSNATSATLSFWHTQSISSGNQDKLRIYYKNATDGQWIFLKEYLYSVASWKQRTIELPNPTANYTIAFEAECNDGFGVALDDVEVTIVPSYALPGDANGDNAVNVSDIFTVISYMLGDNPTPFFFDSADVNNDGSVNVQDIFKIINLINR